MGSAYGRGPATHGAALAAAPWQRSPGSRFVRLRSHRFRSPNGFVRWLSVVAIAPPWSSGGASRAGSQSAVVRRSPSIASSRRRLNRRSPAWARVAWPTGSLPAGNRDAHVGALRALGLSLAGHVALGQFGPPAPASPISRGGGFESARGHHRFIEPGTATATRLDSFGKPIVGALARCCLVPILPCPHSSRG